GMEQKPAGKRIPVFRISREHRALEAGLGLKSRPALEHHYRFWRHAPERRMGQIAKLDSQQRAGAKELIVLESIQNIGDWQPQRIDNHIRSVVEGDEGAAGAHKIA